MTVWDIIRRRIVPFLFLLYIAAYLDRINVGFAALQMNAALGLSPAVYGFGAGIFFLGYVLFEIPSNLLLARVGARRWIARIMISWGAISAAMLFVRGPRSFYALRFLLGVAEAGFLPGLIFYLTRWFPPRERARTVAAFMTATLIAGVIGGPISGLLLSLHGGGLAGWQWLFLVEGLPAIALGVAVLFVLTESPTEARWLTPAQKEEVAFAVAHGTPSRESQGLELFATPRVWRLSLVYFTIPLSLYGIGFWLPQMLKTAGAGSSARIGLISAVPYATGAIAMVLVARHSDRTGERRWHVAWSGLVCAAALALAARAGMSVPWTIAAFSLAMAGLASMLGPFWALATASMSGPGAAAAIALINSVGNVGGFVGPTLLGAVNDSTHGFAAGFYAIAVVVAAGALAVPRDL